MVSVESPTGQGYKGSFVAINSYGRWVIALSSAYSVASVDTPHLVNKYYFMFAVPASVDIRNTGVYRTSGAGCGQQANRTSWYGS